jgi:hypothetical protein
MFNRLPVIMLSVLVAACSTVATGPSVLVLPGTGKDFGLFQNDDALCRQQVQARIAGLGRQPDSRDEGQQWYDIGYIQCMYGKGHKVPVPGDVSYDGRNQWHPPPPPNLPPPADSEPAQAPMSPSR